MPMVKTVPVNLGERSYDVSVGVDVLGEVGAAVESLAAAGRAVVITDSTVRGLYAGAVTDSLAAAGVTADVIDFPAGEASKCLAVYGQVMDRLLGLSPAIDRSAVIVAVGGGVTGDLAGFVAATALRGLDYVNVPTTLLADVDSSVGGKTGIDAPAGKNLIGAFHQPRAVLIDAAVLKTLPPRELGNGLAECVKHAVIRDRSLLEFIEDNAAAIRPADSGVLAELIARNVAIKAAVVAADERESGRRAHLNFGHTIGHAIEAACGYGAIGHGEAVSLGMVAACHIAVARGLIGGDDAGRVRDLLKALSLPVRFDDLPEIPARARDPKRLAEIMAHDKKSRAGVPRFVLPTTLGNVAVFDDVTADLVSDAVNSLE
ncbi:MAG TPA: 3-dehydroquinate synthase [Phycisphaerae bacterium]|nr:3-dehydroquinate synthase [Phycisphaerae bacterium]